MMEYGHYETIQDLIKDLNVNLAKESGTGNIVFSFNALTWESQSSIEKRI